MLGYSIAQTRDNDSAENIAFSEHQIGSNPFPGLRPFTLNESHLFFGRERQVDEILMKLVENENYY